MCYESKLRWYAKHKPRDFEGLLKLISDEKGKGKTPIHGESGEEEVSSPDAFLGRKIALVVGHEPGGGARGEREWNLKVVAAMAPMLAELDSEVFVYEHKARSYSKRIEEMRKNVMEWDKSPDAVLLFHYNSFGNENANGHEFHYRAYKALAAGIRDAWQKAFPASRPRHDDGILENRKGRGSGMLRAAPGPCCLLEPFFESNPKERASYWDRASYVAAVYVEGLRNYFVGKI